MGAWNGLERQYVVSGVLFGLMSVAHNMLLWTAKKYPAFGRWLQWPMVSFAGRALTLAGAAVSLYIFSGMSPL